MRKWGPGGTTHLLTAAMSILLLTGLPHMSAPAHAETPRAEAAAARFSRPVLAFYYTWYHPDTFCRCTMSDLPVKRYESGDFTTIDRQISEAAHAGITGFITSWPGPGNTQDANLATLFARAAAYQRATGVHFVSSIYFESDADAVRKNLTGAMRYAIQHYTKDPHFFRWHGRPVIFIWDPLGNGRTLATWTAIRRQVDPYHRLIWSAEGTDASLLSVFDGLHLFSAADWGLLDGTVGIIDRNFHDQVKARGANKIWAAGVEPGWDDTRVPGRAHPHRVPRRNGATYRASWQAAMHSAPAWITITSFNEWFEGATIEPSVHYRSLYLHLTKRYATRWRHTG